MTPPDPHRPSGDDTPATDLGDRYGTSAPGRRWLLVGGATLVAVVFLGWLAWATLHHSSPTVTSELVGWEAGDTQATARVDVRVDGDPAELGVTCTVTAFARDHTTVGERVWTPEAGTQSVVVRTERPATSVEVVGCTAEGQPRPR